MEIALDKQMDNVLNMTGVSGIIVVDNNGLCLGVKGDIHQTCSGFLSALASQAAQLSDSLTSPVICLEAEHGSLLVKKTDSLTTAIFKSN